MEVRYTNTKDDLVAFNNHHLANNKAYQRRKFINLYITPLILLLAFSILALSSDRVSFYIGGVVGSLASYLWSILAYKRYAKKCADVFQKEVYCEHTVIISETGVSESTENSNCYFDWSAIDRIEGNDEYIFIYNTPATAFVIPKRELGEEAFKSMKRVMFDAK